VIKLQSSILYRLQAATERERQLADALAVRQLERARAAVRLANGIFVIAALMGLAMTALVLHSIVQPLRLTAEALRQINAGQSMVDLPPVADNEFGEMALALRQLRDQAEQLRQLAYTDELTGLGNRAHFDVALREAVADAGRDGHPLALLCIDLDNFGAVNDSLGHSAGDRYLVEAAQRLQRFSTLETSVWRYSGDKFTLLIEKHAMPEDDSYEGWRERVAAQASMILRGLAEPCQIDNHTLSMSGSIGIAVYPDDGITADLLVSSADGAMDAVKTSGRNGLRFANPDHAAVLRRDFALANDIRRGIERGEFEPFYQPIVDVTDGVVVGAEALLRWHHPERGVRAAGEFIASAEASGMVQALGEICLAKVCARIALWQREGRTLWVSANLSTRQIEDRSVLPLLTRLAERDAFAPEQLTLEITESAMLERMERAQATLEELRALGYRLGVDDFGTGYSSFVYLQRFPVDKIKIDRSFVQRMESSAAAAAIISATVTLARSLALDVVAEGVETEAQMRQLVALGCSLQQGFYFTKALPPGEFERWCQGWQAPQW
jgi:diguanylate cyclase (GGDEF)-like protein